MDDPEVAVLSTYAWDDEATGRHARLLVQLNGPALDALASGDAEVEAGIVAVMRQSVENFRAMREAEGSARG